MLRPATLVSLSLFLALALFSSPCPAGQLVLKDIRFARSERAELIHFDMTAFSPPKVFGIEGERPRVVCDFYQARLGIRVDREMLLNGTMIQGVRTGIHSRPQPKLRVVIDLIPGPDYDIQQLYSIKNSRYTISVRKSAQE